MTRCEQRLRRQYRRMKITATVALAALTIALLTMAVHSSACEGPEVIYRTEYVEVPVYIEVEVPVEATPVPTEEPTSSPALTTQYDVPLEQELQEYIITICKEKNISPAVLIAMIQTESQYRADVLGDGGKAYGLMQMHPRWHSERMERLGVTDLLDPFQNVAVGADYLAELIDLYGGNVEMALVAYNAGPQGAERGWFSVGTYTSDYSRKVMTAAWEIAE